MRPRSPAPWGALRESQDAPSPTCAPEAPRRAAGSRTPRPPSPRAMGAPPSTHWRCQVAGHIAARRMRAARHAQRLDLCGEMSINYALYQNLERWSTGQATQSSSVSKANAKEIKNMTKTVTEHSATFHVTLSMVSHQRPQILGKRLQTYSKIQYLYFEC